ncbi:arginase family protein [Chitinophaga sedimenti]|uniref:arginase family protein n=1 Tax=Chitinophaga sedimenti TaxID=2033606 RepID=UPI00200500AB|nr:arginase family protein [Chitinophaga sedimenti]MCK7558706.1 arginase family protein [Chitinophaga sedimenti]
MIDFSHLQDFLSPVSKSFLNDENEYDDFQIGHFVDLYEDEEQIPDFEAAHIILLGVGEQRGGFARTTSTNGPDNIRSEFYRLYHWHRDLKIADAGNLLAGNTLIDAYAAMRAVLTEFIDANKTVIILGGSHDLTYAQYRAYADKKYIIEISVADALIDLMEESSTADTGFLMQLFTEQPNYIRHYNHIGFQSYFVQPRMLETPTNCGSTASAWVKSAKTWRKLSRYYVLQICSAWTCA